VKTSERPKLSFDRTFQASPEEVWELWTTKDGIESWWGPEGFSVTVRSLDLRPGGDLRYSMSAVRAAEIEFMVKAGMPVTTEHRRIFTEVSPARRLAYRESVDFVPGVEPYDVHVEVDFTPVADGVRIVVTFDPMHDDRWTEMARLGRESELDRLAKVLAARQ
jgi:uncharacterized protein YndB with AHSA1/START domain